MPPKRKRDEPTTSSAPIDIPVPTNQAVEPDAPDKEQVEAKADAAEAAAPEASGTVADDLLRQGRPQFVLPDGPKPDPALKRHIFLVQVAADVSGLMAMYDKCGGWAQILGNTTENENRSRADFPGLLSECLVVLTRRITEAFDKASQPE